jgi:hypothetical protein
MSKSIEEQIRYLLTHETNPTVLSNLLFMPGGLFSQTATSEADRKRVSQTALFREALARVRDLEYAEARLLSPAVTCVRQGRSSGGRAEKQESNSESAQNGSPEPDKPTASTAVQTP